MSQTHCPTHVHVSDKYCVNHNQVESRKDSSEGNLFLLSVTLTLVIILYCERPNIDITEFDKSIN